MLKKLVRIHGGRDGRDHWRGGRIQRPKEEKERGTMEQEGLNEVRIERVEGDYGEE